LFFYIVFYKESHKSQFLHYRTHESQNIDNLDFLAVNDL